VTRLLAVLAAVAAAVGAFTLGTHVGAAGVATLLRAQAHRGATLHARYCAVDLRRRRNRLTTAGQSP
jgi:hypothetical protein